MTKGVFDINNKLELSDVAPVYGNLAGMPSRNTSIKQVIQHFQFTLPSAIQGRKNHQSHYICILINDVFERKLLPSTLWYVFTDLKQSDVCGLELPWYWMWASSSLSF